MVTNKARQFGRGIINPIAAFFTRIGLTPNIMTLLGLVLTTGVAVVISQGHLRLAGFLLIAAAGFDALDGTMARMTNRATRFGAFLDSTIDRFSESILILAVLYYYLQQGAQVEVILAFVTVVGSLMVSYTRARAEGLGFSVKVGLLTRFERAIILIAALILNQLTIGLWVLAVLTNVTAIQRMWVVYKEMGDSPLEPQPVAEPAPESPAPEA